MDKYFAYSNDMGILLFDTEDAAIAWCNDEIQYYRKQVELGMFDRSDMASIQYGKLLGGACKQIIDNEHSDYEIKVYKHED